MPGIKSITKPDTIHSQPAGFWPVIYHHAVGWGVGALASLRFLRALRDRLEQHWLAVFLVFFIVSATVAVVHINSLSLASR